MAKAQIIIEEDGNGVVSLQFGFTPSLEQIKSNKTKTPKSHLLAMQIQEHVSDVLGAEPVEIEAA